MAHAKYLSFLLTLFIFIGCGEVRDSSLPAHYPTIHANITILDRADQKEAEVTDGDTIKLTFDGKLTTIRLIGIDAFESRKNDKAYRQAYEEEISVEEVIARGKAAKSYIKALLSKRVDFYMEYDEDFLDRYGRTLAYVWFDETTMLNMKLICEGYALPLTIKPNNRYEREFYDCYQEAKRQGVGVWR
jgi:micrococcal nuclease